MDARFVKIPTDILSRNDLSTTAKCVYANLLDRQGSNGSCWPGTRRIGADVGISQPAVLRALVELSRAGLVKVESQGNGRTNHYRVKTANETLAVSDNESLAVTKCDRSRIVSGGDNESLAEPLTNRAHNQTHKPDPLTRPNHNQGDDDKKVHPKDREPGKPTGAETENRQLDALTPEVMQLIDEWRGPMKTPPTVLARAGQLVLDYGAPVVVEALRITIKNNVQTWNYLETVVRNGAKLVDKTGKTKVVEIPEWMMKAHEESKKRSKGTGQVITYR